MHYKDSGFSSSLRGARKRSLRVIQRVKDLGSSKAGAIVCLLALEASLVSVFAYFSPDKVKVLLNVRTKEELISSVFRQESLSDYKDALIDLFESFSPGQRLDVVSISLDMKAISRLSCRLSEKDSSLCEKSWPKGA